MKKVKHSLLILLGLTCLTGCDQDKITWHQAHQYQGQPDDLNIDTQILASRFKRVQTDR